jgi:short-subunit dehydrogenase
MKAARMKVVLTGAGGGIGAAIARALVSAGGSVLLVGRSEQRLGALAADLNAGARATALAADIARAEGRRAIQEAATAMGANVLINNAGIPSFGMLGSLDEAHVARVVETNLIAPMLLTRALLPQLNTQPEARVLNIGSALGGLALPGFCVYSAAKFGLHGFTEALRRELAGSTVRVQYLAPRTTRTAFNDARVEAFNRATGAQSDSPERVARAALEVLERGTAERYLGFPEKLAVRINALAPRWLDGVFKRHREALRSDHQPA